MTKGAGMIHPNMATLLGIICTDAPIAPKALGAMLSASVEKSEVVCIIGPSGSGKSTILRCINGLESYEAGDILVDGARVDSKASSVVAIRTTRCRAPAAT